MKPTTFLIRDEPSRCALSFAGSHDDARASRTVGDRVKRIESEQQEDRMLRSMKILAVLGVGLAALLGPAQRSNAQQDALTAVDIALEPDATMMQHAKADNARLLKAFPKGFALDATHHAHLTMLQQFVRTDDLENVYIALNKVFASEKPLSWKLQAFKYYYIP